MALRGVLTFIDDCPFLLFPFAIGTFLTPIFYCHEHAEAIGSFITNLPAPFWMFASVVVACLTAIYISSKK